ncbi:MAG: hypothetical protein ACWGON_09775, partial [Gemmatimonadota bacterium]
MTESDPDRVTGEVTRLLHGVREGDATALDRVYELVYSELSDGRVRIFNGRSYSNTLRPLDEYVQDQAVPIPRTDDASLACYCLPGCQSPGCRGFRRATGRNQLGLVWGHRPLQLEFACTACGARSIETSSLFDERLREHPRPEPVAEGDVW